MHETAKYLRIKSALYDTKTNPDNEYKKLVAQQVVVNEKQEQVRELLFKNRELLKESIRSGRLLVLTFADLVDLYEHIMASWYDYDSLREKFSSTGILDKVSTIIKNIADELDNIGFAIQSNSSYKKKYDLVPELIKLKSAIDIIGAQNKNILILKKIFVNLRNIGERVNGLSSCFGDSLNERKIRNDKSIIPNLFLIRKLTAPSSKIISLSIFCVPAFIANDGYLYSRLYNFKIFAKRAP